MEERFGPYELHERLGAGGMGIVYRAQDTQLERWVAIKVLSAAAVADPDRLSRFVQEAKTTSALSHPNITTIHQLGDADGRHYIVMELVQGDNLRQRMQHGALEIAALLDIGIQAAEGLAAAHAAGVVHRDLKPENLMLRPDGIVKILDFGLAKLLQADATSAFAAASDETVLQSPSSPVPTSQPTVPGMVMGTVGYMAPEQVRGAGVDHRADIFALGCVLYELAAGQRAFSGDSAIETMHAILKEPVRSLHELRPDAPPELERILRKALAKDPGERYQSAKDLAIDLRAARRDLDPRSSDATWGPPSTATRAVAPARTRRWLPAAIAAALVVVAVAAVFLLRGVQRTSVTPPVGLQITRLTSTGNADWPALSPDGRYVAYVRNEIGRYSIWLRQIATNAESEHVPSGVDPLGALVFTPDSNWLYYIVVGKGSLETTLHRIPVLGGAPVRVYEDVDSPVSFAPDGSRFVFTRMHPPLASETYIGVADGATPPQRVVDKGGADFLSFALWAPDGRSIVCTALDARDVSRVRLAQFAPTGGKVEVFDKPEWAGILGMAWIPDGSGLFVAGVRSAQDPAARLFRVRLRSGVVQPITTDLNSYTGVTASTDGKLLASLRSTTTTNFWRMPVSGDPVRDTGAASQIGYGTARIDGATPSPDGTAIAFSSDASGATDLWRMNLDGTDTRALTAGPASEMTPRWSPDGKRIAYTLLQGDSARVWVMNADGTGARQLVFGVQSGAPDWAPDSRTIVYHQARDATSTVWKLDVDGGAPVLLCSEATAYPCWSPSGESILCWAFTGEGDKTKPTIALLPATGGKPRPLPIPIGSESLSSTWSADGAHVTAIVAENGASNLVDYPLEGGAARALTQFGPGLRIYGFTWLRDGSGLVLERGTSTRDVVLLQNF